MLAPDTAGPHRPPQRPGHASLPEPRTRGRAGSHIRRLPPRRVLASPQPNPWCPAQPLGAWLCALAHPSLNPFGFLPALRPHRVLHGIKRNATWTATSRGHVLFGEEAQFGDLSVHLYRINGRGYLINLINQPGIPVRADTAVFHPHVSDEADCPGRCGLFESTLS